MVDLVVPPLGESITEAVVARWLKQVGEAVAVDEAVAELETDKVTVQLPSPVSGALKDQRVAVGATVRVGQVIGSVDSGAPGTAVVARVQPPVAARPAPPQASAQLAHATSASRSPPPPVISGNGAQLDGALRKLTPSQRQHAREVGEAPRSTPAAPSVDDRLARVDPRDEIVAMSPLRKRVAERLVQAQHEAAALTTFNEVDMTAITNYRANYKDAFEKAHGVKLGFMSFFVKACVAACKLYPGINAELIGGSIVYKKHYDFGIAVSAPKGLVVPVLRGVDALTFPGVENGIVELADKARAGTLGLDDLTGGTFSITNGGIYGSMMSTPLLNYPQTGILGMHNIAKRAVVVGDDITIRPMMYVALSYDHRVVDGREAVSFLVAVKQRLEAPERLLLEA